MLLTSEVVNVVLDVAVVGAFQEPLAEAALEVLQFDRHRVRSRTLLAMKPRSSLPTNRTREAPTQDGLTAGLHADPLAQPRVRSHDEARPASRTPAEVLADGCSAAPAGPSTSSTPRPTFRSPASRPSAMSVRRRCRRTP